ncbi:hypothetical protein GCM10010156_72970 [Planobispora rosea]|uniref:TrwC relaxase domain-containing protein n=1 Tax=Planobispora rosea TaxID=35762 RepID=A0A8J3WII8_PLARO|nr:relaxase domain-containing protein [Planobispora rosea]GGT04570.1 hypothetical protein GCM10010156_72970 [Planobispora rosea]GIH88891.1 hypothetical protein Pro02_72990 [Planobispora rosea]
MACIVDLGPSAAQVHYRLRPGIVCDRRGSIDGPVCPLPPAPALVAEDGTDPMALGAQALQWTGSSLANFGITPGTPLTADEHPVAAALMAGRHPHTGRRLLAGTETKRNRGYEITLAAPASLSTLYALGTPEVAASIAALVAQAISQSAGQLERWLVGRARRAGLMGWIIVHHSTPALLDRLPRPCLHAHLVLAALMAAPDGEWTDIAGPARQRLYGYVEAVEADARSRMRRLLSDHHGVGWERDHETGRWEIVSARAELYERSPLPRPACSGAVEDARLADIAVSLRAQRGGLAG